MCVNLSQNTRENPRFQSLAGNALRTNTIQLVLKTLTCVGWVSLRTLRDLATIQRKIILNPSVLRYCLLEFIFKYLVH